MSLLFLIPAMKLGVNCKNAIYKSYKWLLGENQLKIKMISKNPFFIFRSIEKRSQKRIHRYLRCLANQVAKSTATLVSNGLVTVNKECRSYHLGWLLYVWSEIENFHD